MMAQKSEWKLAVYQKVCIVNIFAELIYLLLKGNNIIINNIQE